MSVNMFRCRLTSEAQPRTKNGQPPHSTTGLASTNWPHVIAAGGITCISGCPGITSASITTRIGAVSTSDHVNRRVMSSSSGLRSSSVTVRGSSAIPQMGHAPGASRTISGCIGQVQSVRVAGARRRRLERHAALRTGARPDLSHLGVHRARVLAGVGSDRRWTSGHRRCGADEGLGVRRELLLTGGAAEVVGPCRGTPVDRRHRW